MSLAYGRCRKHKAITYHFAMVPKSGFPLQYFQILSIISAMYGIQVLLAWLQEPTIWLPEEERWESRGAFWAATIYHTICVCIATPFNFLSWLFWLCTFIPRQLFKLARRTESARKRNLRKKRLEARPCIPRSREFTPWRDNSPEPYSPPPARRSSSLSSIWSSPGRLSLPKLPSLSRSPRLSSPRLFRTPSPKTPSPRTPSLTSS